MALQCRLGAINLLARLCCTTAVLLLVVWLQSYLGGFALAPAYPAYSTLLGATNDTGGIFNWHPLLMSFAFLVCMTEAMSTYTASPYLSYPREKQKLVHMGLHSAAAASLALGLVAAFQSHNLKRPDPIPNLYSTHSYLGITVATIVFAQYAVAMYSFIWPGITPARRKELAPWHAFFGSVAFAGGLATMMVGIQEKATFVQVFAKPAMYSAALRIPAVLQVLILATGVLVMLQRVAARRADDPAEARLLPQSA